MRKGLIALIAATAICLLAPGAACGLGVSGTVTPASLQAGVHSDIAVHVDFTGGQVKDLTIGLPPGVVGDPTADSRVHRRPAQRERVSRGHTGRGGLGQRRDPRPAPARRPGQALQPRGAAWRAGAVRHRPLARCRFRSARSSCSRRSSCARPTSGSTPSSTTSRTRQSSPGDTTITSQDITLYGTAPGTGKPFMRNPTSCTPATTNFSAVPYSGADGTGQASFTPTGCDSVPFSPTFSARVGARVRPPRRATRRSAPRSTRTPARPGCATPRCCCRRTSRPSSTSFPRPARKPTSTRATAPPTAWSERRSQPRRC